jgi:ribonuclease P/MRP protein subunit RPP40
MRIPLKQETESIAVRARQKAALKLWDELRENGPGKWEVLYCQGGKSAGVGATVFGSKPADRDGI